MNNPKFSSKNSHKRRLTQVLVAGMFLTSLGWMVQTPAPEPAYNVLSVVLLLTMLEL